MVGKELVDSTLQQSIANNTLDKKMAETPTRGGPIEYVVYRFAAVPVR